MYCNNCGKEIRDDSIFCPECGNKVLVTDKSALEEKQDNIRNLKKQDCTYKGKVSIVLAVLAVAFMIFNLGFWLSNMAEIHKLENKQQENEVNEINEINEIKDVIDADNDAISVGDYITFGRYEQDSNSSNGTEEIEWRVLAKRTDDEDGREAILITSKYVLNCLPYHEKDEDVIWYYSTMRSWLNNQFYNAAFTSEEKGQIKTIENDNPNASSYNSRYEGLGGGSTSENVFLLSFVQVQNLFDGSDDMKCSPTKYAERNGVNTNDNNNSYWWLRSPGDSQNYAMYIDYSGEISATKVDNGDIGVRPTLWIYVD